MTETSFIPFDLIAIFILAVSGIFWFAVWFNKKRQTKWWKKQ